MSKCPDSSLETILFDAGSILTVRILKKDPDLMKILRLQPQNFLPTSYDYLGTALSEKRSELIIWAFEVYAVCHYADSCRSGGHHVKCLYFEYGYANCCYAERLCAFVKLSVILLIVTILMVIISVFILSMVMLKAVMLHDILYCHKLKTIMLIVFILRVIKVSLFWVW